jgi:chemotaxis methyl-accepting protein methylase
MRNTLMYFNAETQRNVLGRLHFALAANHLGNHRTMRQSSQPRKVVCGL